MGALTEYIFSHAVALQQSGRLRSNIFVHKRDVYILNMDHTIILNFTLPLKEPSFESPIAFSANDYDSETFEEKNGRIVFTKKNRNTGVVRTKTCAGVETTFEEAKKLFHEYYKALLGPHSRFSFEKETLSYLEENLSHIEISSQSGKWNITQKDIYTGNMIELERLKTKGELLADAREDLKHDFGPIGIRTNDFLALFNFNDMVELYFPIQHPEFCLLSGKKFNMQGVIAGCVYDELGTMETIKGGEKNHGRKKSKNRTNKQKVSPAIGEGTRRRRRRN